MGRKGKCRVTSPTVHKTCDIIAQTESAILSNFHDHKETGTCEPYSSMRPNRDMKQPSSFSGHCRNEHTAYIRIDLWVLCDLRPTVVSDKDSLRNQDMSLVISTRAA